MMAPTTIPVRLAPAGAGVTGGDTVIAGRDIVVDPGPVEPIGLVELGGIETAGRDIVEDAEGADGAAAAAARIPVADAGAAPAAARMPVEESDPVAACFGEAAPGTLGGDAGGAAGAVAGARGRRQCRSALHAELRAGLGIVTASRALHGGPSVGSVSPDAPRTIQGRSPTRPAAMQPCVVFSSRERCRAPAPRQWTQVYMLGAGLGMPGDPACAYRVSDHVSATRSRPKLW